MKMIQALTMAVLPSRDKEHGSLRASQPGEDQADSVDPDKPKKRGRVDGS
jgi:hypothetical protein